MTGRVGSLVDLADESRLEGACCAGGEVEAEAIDGGGLVENVADRAEGGGDGTPYELPRGRFKMLVTGASKLVFDSGSTSGFTSSPALVWSSATASLPGTMTQSFSACSSWAS